MFFLAVLRPSSSLLFARTRRGLFWLVMDGMLGVGCAGRCLLVGEKVSLEKGRWMDRLHVFRLFLAVGVDMYVTVGCARCYIVDYCPGVHLPVTSLFKGMCCVVRGNHQLCSCCLSCLSSIGGA